MNRPHADQRDAQSLLRVTWPIPQLDEYAAADVVLAAGHAQFTPQQREHFRAVCQDYPAGRWEDIFLLAGKHNMRSLLWFHLAQEGMESLVEPNVWAVERTYYQAQLLRLLRLTSELRALLAVCQTAGIRVIPRKGPALALRLYHCLGPRPSRDLDLLIDVHANQRSVFQLLGTHITDRKERGILIEIAWSLLHYLPYQRTFDANGIWQRAVPSSFKDIPCYALHPRDELRYLCAHHVVHHRAAEWLWLVDISELLQSNSSDPGWDWSAFVAECVAAQTALPVLIAFVQARVLLDAPVPDEAIFQLDKAAQSQGEQSRWAALQLPGNSWKGIVSTMRTATSLAEIYHLMRMIIWPDRERLSEYYNWLPNKHATIARIRRIWGIIHNKSISNGRHNI
jgi:hypothetical protein